MSEYLSDKPKKLTIRDKNDQIKNFQEFKHNENGDPVYYRKTENEKVTVELTYEYEYDEIGRKKVTKIIDLVTSNITIMEYEY